MSPLTRRPMRALRLALSAAVLISLMIVAPVAQAATPDDVFPGIAAPASPFQGSVEATGDVTLVSGTGDRAYTMIGLGGHTAEHGPVGVNDMPGAHKFLGRRYRGSHRQTFSVRKLQQLIVANWLDMCQTGQQSANARR